MPLAHLDLKGEYMWHNCCFTSPTLVRQWRVLLPQIALMSPNQAVLAETFLLVVLHLSAHELDDNVHIPHTGRQDIQLWMWRCTQPEKHRHDGVRYVLAGKLKRTW